MDKKIKILFVQEEKSLTEIMFNYLSTSFTVTCLNNITKISNILVKSHFDLIILDTKNRYGNSIKVCKYLKESTNLKIIFISKDNNIEIKEKCFEAGCDDFLTKPFFPKEMIIRINKQVGIYDNTSNITSKGLLLNKKDKTLTVHKNTILLSNSEYLIVEYMLNSSDTVQTQLLTSYLSNAKEKEISQSALTVLIKRLRNKLNKGTGMEIIKNRYGRGYYLGI